MLIQQIEEFLLLILFMQTPQGKEILTGIPGAMPDEHYRPINIHGMLNLWLFVAFAVILLVFGVVFLVISRKQELESAKRIKVAFGLFGIFYGICRIVFILMFQPFTLPQYNYDLLANIAYTFGMLGFSSIVWALEKVKYEDTNYFLIAIMILTVMTGVGVIFNILNIANLREFILIVIMLGTPITGFFIILLYIQVIQMSTGELRTKAIYSLLGFIIMVVGITMDGQFFLGIESVPLWFKMDVVPLLSIGGYLMFAVNQF